MRWAVAAIALFVSFAARAETALPNQTLVFYNARVALREDKPTDVLKLWLLRNSLVQRGERSLHDDEFRSVVWAALGELGLCQDGYPKDDRGGAGVWPLALHNWVVRSMSRGPPPSQPAPFDVFEVGRQQRFISLRDVLSTEEIRSASFFRTDCLLVQATLLELGLTPWGDLKDRLTVGWILRELLVLSKTTLVREKVQNLAAIEARLFDLDLAIAELEARKARREARADAQQARSLGVSEQGAADLREQQIASWPETSKQAVFLRHSLTWSADEWLSLSSQRRLSLFSQARTVSRDPEATEKLVLSIIDALIAQKQGEEVEAWIGFLGARETVRLRNPLTVGERGKRLLELEPEAGFRERSAIALHRGVAFLEAGELKESLRSFAYAMQQAEASREASATVALARRWLSYVLSRYETTAEIVDLLKALVPRQEYNAVVEDLVWRAALRADVRSFEQVVSSVRRGGAFDGRVAKLRPLAQGKPGVMATELRAALDEEPYSTLRFIRQLVESLEVEDGDVRLANISTLKLLVTLLDPLTADTGKRRSAHARAADELLGRTQAMLDGLRHLDLSPTGKARAMSPRHEAFAGSIRLAPADPLPWPFDPPQVRAPSAFVPMVLEPVEWRDRNGERVFGWRITE